MLEISPPWEATLTSGQYTLINYFLVVAGFALLGAFLRALSTAGEVGPRFRPAMMARLAITAVAALSYLMLVIQMTVGYDATDAGYVPNSEAVMTMAPRYMDWSVTVPLLVVELLAVCVIAGAPARRTRAIAFASAFLMIFTGFLGAFIVGEGSDGGARAFWGAVSVVFWIITNVVLIGAVRRSSEHLTPEAARLLRVATALLLGGWVVYPLVYVIPFFGFGGGWTTTMHVALSIADVGVKIGFGTLLHRVAKLRTAEDVRAGADVHTEAIWISSVKQSDAGTPRETFLAEHTESHPRRARPPMSAGVPGPVEFDPSELPY